MNRFMVEDTVVEVPEWVVDLESFRRWGNQDDFPEKAQISYLRGEVWVDLSREQLFTHNEVKGEICTVLGRLVKARDLGHYFSWGAYLSNDKAEFAHKPDGTFVSFEAYRDGRVKVPDELNELIGSPDMVLEVVSRSTVEKDNVLLRSNYFQAGIREYWLVDARKPPHTFDILRRGRSGFVAVRKRADWTRSDVFDASFRLIQKTAKDGHPSFDLEIQAADPS